MSEKLYTAAEVAKHYGVKTITVWDWIRRGKLRAKIIGGRNYRVTEEMLREFEKETDETAL